jgi:hypothetical protein
LHIEIEDNAQLNGPAIESQLKSWLVFKLLLGTMFISKLLRRDRPDPMLFKRVNNFCYKRGLDWEGARDMPEIVLMNRSTYECEMIWRLT